VALRPSKGAHLVVRSSSLSRPQAAFSVPAPGRRGQYLFAVPQADGNTYVGITDDPIEGEPPESVSASAAEVEFLRDGISTALSRPLAREEIVGTFAGLRPLLDESSGARPRKPGAAVPTRDLSRKHAVLRSREGVWTLVGGKLTTYRRMAQDLVDRLTDAPCRTRELPLVGAADRRTLAGLQAPPRLVRRYGTEALDVVALAESDPARLRPIAEGLELTEAELRFGLFYEGAMGIDDLLDRRSRVGLVPADRALAEPVAARIAGLLGTVP
jgi:glycerol-3-phosphate dehydrogenase